MDALEKKFDHFKEAKRRLDEVDLSASKDPELDKEIKEFFEDGIRRELLNDVEEKVAVKPETEKKPQSLSVVRQSNLAWHFRCHYAYFLSFEQSLERTEAMREGLLFEGYVLGFKNNDEGALKGRKREKSLEFIKTQAMHAKPYFIRGKAYVPLTTKYKSITLQGEADYVGVVRYNSQEIECICDLKRTGDIVRIWDKEDGKANKQDYLQAVYYSYIHYKMTKKRLPFIYTVVDSKYDVPIIRQIMVNVDSRSFDWLEKTLNDRVVGKITFKPNQYSCLIPSSFSQSSNRCPFMWCCSFGKSYVSESYEIDFNEDLYGD